MLFRLKEKVISISMNSSIMKSGQSHVDGGNGIILLWMSSRGIMGRMLETGRGMQIPPAACEDLPYGFNSIGMGLANGRQEAGNDH